MDFDLTDGLPLARAVEEHIAEHYYVGDAPEQKIQHFNESSLQIITYEWLRRHAPDAWEISFEHRSDNWKRRADLYVDTGDASVVIEVKYVKVGRVHVPDSDAPWHVRLAAQADAVEAADSLLDVSHLPFGSDTPSTVLDTCVAPELPKLDATAKAVGATHKILLVGVGPRVEAVDVV